MTFQLLELLFFDFPAMDMGWFLDFLKRTIKSVLAVVLVAVCLSYMQKLGLESFLQLSIIGFVLQFIFNQDHSIWIILAYLFMVSVAGYTAGQPDEHVPKGKIVAGIFIVAALRFIYKQDHSIWIILAYLFMVSVAGYTAGQRAKRVPKEEIVAGIFITAVFRFIFNQDHSIWIILAYLFMVSVAGYIAGKRPKHDYTGKIVAGIFIAAVASIAVSRSRRR